MTTNKKRLLFSVRKDDLEIQTFCSGGKGGQNQNKRFTGVRIIHKESGAIGECREERNQLQNKKIALKRLSEHPKFKIWVSKKTYEIENKTTIKKEIDKLMDEEFLKIETKNKDGNWVEKNV